MGHSPIPGILCLCAGASIFSMQDVVIKLMSSGYPLSEVLTVRCLVACVPLVLLLQFGGGGLRALNSQHLGLLLIRSAMLLVSYTTYYLAMASLPLAVVVALSFAAPLFIVLLSGPFLGETVRPSQFVAVLIGFLGVLVICFGPYFADAAPGAEAAALFDPAALLALASALFYGASALLARKLADTESGAVMASFQNIIFLSGASLIALTTNLGADLSTGIADESLQFLLRPWVMPDRHDLLLIASTGLVGAGGSFLLTQAYRLTQANVVAPFEYVSILLAAMLGWWIWDEVPSLATYAGIILIIGAGLYVLRSKPDAI
ncbi:DMT family transporter [Dongia mobilis]|uniref:DMT family transporter n=1 Tax=Dongia sp. TaxID=1977262 RepID=UPI0026F211DB